MLRRFSLFALILVMGTAAFGASLESSAQTAATTFLVRIENVSQPGTLQPSDGSNQAVPLSPGVWTVHTAPAPLFTPGAPDRGLGLEAISEDGQPGQLAAVLADQPGVVSGGVFNTPFGASGPGPLTPGNAYEFTVEATPGMYLSFVTMFVPSNDLFYAPDARGIPLFDATGRPINGVVRSALIALWDAGTEVNQEPGVGADQVQRQAELDTGTAELGVVQSVSSGFQGHAYPQTSEVIRVQILVRP